MSDVLAVSEIFGPTIQGEGVSAGQVATFVRLAGCNLACSWCDTPYTWDWTGKNGTKYDTAQEVTHLSVDEVVSVVGRVPLVVITGGEPMLQGGAVRSLVGGLPPLTRVEIETNGTRPLLGELRSVSYNVSPKLRHAGNDLAPLLDQVIARWARPDVRLKFVVERLEDITEVDDIVGRVRQRDVDISDRVWLMPQARTVAELDAVLPETARLAIARGYNVSDRLHIRLWGDERGH